VVTGGFTVSLRKRSVKKEAFFLVTKTKEHLPLTGWYAYLLPERSWKLDQTGGRVPAGQIPWYLLTS